MKWLVKNKKQQRQLRAKKKIIIRGILGVALTIVIVVGIVSVWSASRPLYISPLPLMKEVLGFENTEKGTKTVEKALLIKGILFEKIEVTDESDYLVKLRDNGEVLLSGKKELASQIASLQVILVRLTMEGKQFKKLDLRFSKPVINFNQKEVILNEVQAPSPTTAVASPSAQIDQ